MCGQACPRRSPKTRFADVWRLMGLLFGVALTLAWIAFLGYEVFSWAERVM